MRQFVGGYPPTLIKVGFDSQRKQKKKKKDRKRKKQ